MEPLVIDLNQLAATVELPADFVADRMSFVDPLCAQLSPQSAYNLRASALRMLKVQHHFLSLPPTKDTVKKLAREFLLQKLAFRETELADPLFNGFPGATYEERKKAHDDQHRKYAVQETALFYDNPELWWQHRVRDAFDTERSWAEAGAAMQRKMPMKPRGCMVPIVVFCAFGWWASRLLFT